MIDLSSERFDGGRAAAPASGRDPRRLAEILEEILRLGPSTAERLIASLVERSEVRVAFTDRSEKDRQARPGEVEGMLRELQGVGWVELKEGRWTLMKAGEVLAGRRPVMDSMRFARALCLAHEEHNKHVISRLLALLWEINPERQGAVILAPPPVKSAPDDRKSLGPWLSSALPSWFGALGKQMSGFAVPASLDEIAQKVERTLGEGWDALSPRMRRKRLGDAMTDLLHDLLFGRVVAKRDLSVWQSRMDWAGFTLLARRLPDVSGRVWFPVGAFRRPGNPSFTPIDGLVRDGLSYHVYTPSGPEAEERFAAALYDCYRLRQRRDRVEYVSLLSVRDHVCYLLRIGNAHFEGLLQRIFPRVLSGELPYAMALEVDLSPADRRRVARALPVIVDHIPRYILSMRRRRAPRRAAT